MTLTWLGWIVCTVALITSYWCSRCLYAFFDAVVLQVGPDFYRMGFWAQFFVLGCLLIMLVDSIVDGSTIGPVAVWLCLAAGWLYGLIEKSTGKSKA